MKKKKMNNIFLIITANKFPLGDAGALRLQAYAKIILELGYKPYVICMGETTNYEWKHKDDISYCSLRYSKHSLFHRILGRVLYNKHLRKLLNEFKRSDIQGILIDSGTRKTFQMVQSYAKLKEVPLIYDSVEWYSPSEFVCGEWSPAYRLNKIINEKLINTDYKVIAISKHLENHFIKKSIEAIRIPVIIDFKPLGAIKQSERACGLKIVYAGSIGNKDHIKEMVDAINLLDADEKRRISFNIIGITKNQYEKCFGVLQEGLTQQSVFFMGRVERDTVLEQLESADFSFLLRPANERYAQAGFPTKVVEALASGVPMLTNYTSDLELYLKDEENSIIIEECSTEACLRALRRLLQCSHEHLQQMNLIHHSH